MSILNYQQSQLDCSKIESINKSQLVDLINNFSISYLDKLKKLMVNVDSKLFNLNSKIIACQSNLVILESRVSSIPGLNSINYDLKDKKNASQQNNQTDQIDSQQKNDELKKENKVEDNKLEDDKESNESANKEELNPEIMKYKRMLSVGVPLGAIQLKMKAEGLDPDLLK